MRSAAGIDGHVGPQPAVDRAVRVVDGCPMDRVVAREGPDPPAPVARGDDHVAPEIGREVDAKRHVYERVGPEL